MAPFADVPALSHWQVITDEEIERIHAAVLRLMNRVGFRICSRPILERLERRGFRVDYATSTVRATPTQMALVEETARAHVRQDHAESWRQERSGLGATALLRRPVPKGETVGHNFTCYYDATEGMRRAATLQDIRNVVKAWHMMPEITQTRTCMTAQDVPPPIEPIVSTVEVMKLTDKIASTPEMILSSQLPYLEELETIMTGEQVTFHSNGCSVNHFTLDERAAECLLATAENGLESWWTNSCPVAGANAPVTLAGATVVGVAEQVGAWLAGWAFNEDVALAVIPLAGVLDPRTGAVRFSTPESILIDCAMYQYFYRMYGMRIGLCKGYTDAKVPGMQAINDKMLKGLAYGLFTDELAGQTGTLEAGNTYSPTQQVIDLEINRQIAQIARGMEVTDASMGLDDIERFAVDPSASFMMMDQTLKNWRGSVWSPSLMDRTPFVSR